MNSDREMPPAPYMMREFVVVGETRFSIDRPILKRDVPDHPENCYPFADEDNPPEWAAIWPAGRMLAAELLRQSWPPGHTCLEVGCGMGLVGIAALSCGIDVMFSDFNTMATEIATHNARLNGFTKFKVDSFDWGDPPADLRASLIVGSDVTYYPQSHEKLIGLIDLVLKPDGLAMISDPNRESAKLFVALVKSRGWNCELQTTFVDVPAQCRVDGTIYRLTRPSHKPS